jgi:hypothetical protein
MHLARQHLIWMTVLLAAPAAAQRSLWIQRTLAPEPTPLSYRMAYDEARGVTVAVGASMATVETWEFDGTNWTQASPEHAPPPLPAYHAMTYDTDRARVVLTSSNGAATDVWEWDGADWTQHTAATSPAVDRDYAIAYDGRSGLLVLHGGIEGTTLLGATWVWNGIDWQQVGTGGPVPRKDHAMAYDRARQQLVLFGGTGPGASSLSDTWTWDGQWFEFFGIAAPPARMPKGNLVWDSTNSMALLYGGTTGTGSLQDVWEWDGMEWTSLPTFSAPPTSGPIAYDAARNVTVALLQVGGAMQTWELVVRPPMPGGITSFGEGCAGRGGVLQLDDETEQNPIIGGPLSVEISNLPPNQFAAAFLLFGVSNTEWGGIPLPVDLGIIGMPGCGLQVSIDFVVPVAITGNVAPWTVQIPANEDLVNGTFYLQGLVFDSPFFPAGSVSNGLAVTIGNS